MPDRRREFSDLLYAFRASGYDARWMPLYVGRGRFVPSLEFFNLTPKQWEAIKRDPRIIAALNNGIIAEVHGHMRGPLLGLGKPEHILTRYGERYL